MSECLETAAPVLGLYYRALCDRDAAIVACRDDDRQERAGIDGAIRLPARVARWVPGPASFAWYKVALTHRAAHYEGGTFAFAFERDATRYERLRPRLADAVSGDGKSDLETFFALFAQRDVAIDLFVLCEDLRLDEWSKRRYPGLRAAYEGVQRTALLDRADIASLRPRDALAEYMLRLSLSADVPPLGGALHAPARDMRSVLAPLREDGATVEDSAEAALRAYRLLEHVTGIERGTPWIGVAAVAYRDRLASRWMHEPVADALDQQALHRFGLPTRRTRARRAGAHDYDPPPHTTLPKQSAPQDDASDADVGGPLVADEPFAFLYPEWDHVAGIHRRDWCLLRETRIEPGPSTRYFDETLHAYGALVPEIRRQIERLNREGLRKVHRVPHGDDVDLDAAIAALVDQRAGLSPSDQVYVSRRKVVRDVAAAFLVDVSSSTGEQVDITGARATSPLAQRARTLHGRNYRTILDVEKETVALLMTALERIGDAYGIYCFSGMGREDVRFMVMKAHDERLSERVAARLANVKPLHTTRMAPAIRHAARKLRGREARTRLLVLISDGRPFDLDYGQRYGNDAEVEYAIRDTRQALDEVRDMGVQPFVLTVDPLGNDYLGTMCHGLDYEVLHDIDQLPSRLLALYRGLTGG